MPKENSSGLIIVAPHKKISREVKLSDLETIKGLYLPLEMLMNDLENSGAFSDVYAIAHQQVEEKDPLRFFVINANNKEVIRSNDTWDLPDYIIINPIITRHTNIPVTKSEGCLSFPNFPNNDVDRWNKIEVEFYTINHEGTALVKHQAKCAGKLAQIFQHEIDHFNCEYVWKEFAIKK